MKPFIKTLTIFVLPIVLLFFLPVFIIVKSGEISDPQTLFARQHYRQNSLVGLAYSYPVKQYKLDGINFTKPEVLVLGSSRVMQVRSYFFNNNTTFYNAGGFLAGIHDLDCFIHNKPSSYNPRILLLGIDQYWFNNAYDTTANDRSCNIEVQPQPLTALVKYNFTKIISQVYKGQIKLAGLLKNNIGLSAQMNDEGFRDDGSYRYGKLLAHPEQDEDYGFKDTYKRIRDGSNRFEYGTGVSLYAVHKLDAFLQACHNKNIQVIAFLPPYAHIIADTMTKLGDKYAYIAKLPSALQPVFDKYNFTLANYTDEAWVGAENTEFIDGFHGSEKAMLRVLIDLNKKNSLLNKYCDTVQLKKILVAAKSPRNILND